jgi:hypothetical protein
MTEAEWLDCAHPDPMLEFLRGRASDRKLRLFSVACCRRIWHLLADERSRRAVEVAEGYADGSVNDQQLRIMSGEAASVGIGFGVQFSAANAAHFAAQSGQVHADRCAMYAARAVGRPAESAAQAHLLRCLFGNPFRPVSIDPACLRPDVIALAQAIYDDRAFDRIPSLGASLEDASCEDQAILSHCRARAEHVRGCWVVDVVLVGRERSVITTHGDRWEIGRSN